MPRALLVARSADPNGSKLLRLNPNFAGLAPARPQLPIERPANRDRLLVQPLRSLRSQVDLGAHVIVSECSKERGRSSEEPRHSVTGPSEPAAENVSGTALVDFIANRNPMNSGART